MLAPFQFRTKGSETMSRAIRFPALTTALLLLVVMVGFWYVALVVPAQEATVTMHAMDLYNEHYPFAKYGGEMLRSGEIPLWNPYQLNGLPFLAVPHSRLFYPPNLIYLLPATGVAIEVDLVFHWLFAGVGLWLLVRAWGMGHVAGFAAATSFMLSRWLVDAIQWPGIIAGAAWLPWTLLAIEGVFRRRRWASIGLALALALQLFNGAAEFIVYNAYACGLYTGMRLIVHQRTQGVRDSFVRLGVLTSALVAGVGLAAIQIIPTLELLAQSGRLSGGTSLDYARGGLVSGFFPPALFFERAWRSQGWPALGVLPAIGVLLFPKERSQRLPWLLALILVGYSTLLIFGGSFFELYFNTPVGQVFRRPSKFFYQYNLGLGIFAACAVTRLLTLRHERSLLVPRHWSACVAGIAAVGWGIGLLRSVTVMPFLLLSIALFIAFVVVRDPKQRMVICLALCISQVGDLTLAPRNDSIRPFRQEHRFDELGDLLDLLRDRAGFQRIYTSTKFTFDPATAAKQGLLRHAYMAVDYEPLATARQRDYYLRASMEPPPTRHFSGGYNFGPNTRWAMLDDASVRFYLAGASDPGFDRLRRLAAFSHRTGVHLHHERVVDVIERTQALPRAYFVPSAIAISDANEILDRVSARNFRARDLVLLELPTGTPTRRGRSPARARVAIEAPDPETVTLDLRSDQAGYVVLTDTWYPGWEATVNGEPAAIHRANFLFRAVEVPRGRSHIVYRYVPRSFRVGAGISGLFALAVGVVSVWIARRRRNGPADLRAS